MNKPIDQKLKLLWSNWVKPMVVVIAIITPLRSSLADWNDVPTGSMKPTILEGDRVLVNKLAYDLKLPFTTHRLAEWGDPQRNDIVVCLSPADGTRLIKRVIAIPGDVIAMQNNVLMINGERATYSLPDKHVIQQIPKKERHRHTILEEQCADHQHPVMLTPNNPSPSSFQPVTVPEGKYVVMGDNRDNSFDSRLFGFVSREHILGRSRRVVFSLNYDHYLLPRNDRWLKALR